MQRQIKNYENLLAKKEQEKTAIQNEIKQLSQKETLQWLEINQLKGNEKSNLQEIDQLRKKEKSYLTKIEQMKENEKSLLLMIEQMKENEKSHLLEIEQMKEKEKSHLLEIKKLQKQKNQSDIKSSKEEAIARGIQILGEDDISEFEKHEEIGFGGGGKVYKVTKNQTFAMKEMNIKNSDAKNFQNFLGEYEIMNLFNHPNIIKTFGLFLSETRPPCIILEYCPKNLEQLILDNKCTKVELVFYIYQIVEGMRCIHEKNVIHRDLKPTNILITRDGIIKISDFGISKLMTVEEQTMTLGAGTQKFMAPEIINEEDHYNEKVDVYSFGVVLFYILSGGQLPRIKIFDIPKGKKAPIPDTFSDFARELISNCWNLEPKDRPSFNDIIEMLEQNNFQIMKLDDVEIKEVEVKVKQHMTKIPKYDD